VEVMAFDPKEYLADGENFLPSKSGGKSGGKRPSANAFNPDTYLSETHSPYEMPPSTGGDFASPMESWAGGVGQGLAFDFLDEGYGVVGGLWDKFINREGFKYTENRDAARKFFQNLEQQNPTSYMVGNLGGAVFSPVNKVFAPLAAAGRIGKLKNFDKLKAFKNAPMFAAEGAAYAAGASKADNPLGFAGDVVAGGVGGGLLGAGAEKALDFAGKAYKGVSKNWSDISKQRTRMMKTGEILGDLPKYFAEYIVKHPEDWELYGKQVITANDLTFVVADKVNKLRKETDDIWLKLDSMLSDEPIIDFPSIKALVTKHQKKMDKNPYGKSGRKIGVVHNEFLDMIKHRIKTYQNKFERHPGQDPTNHKISPEVLRKILEDMSDEISDVSSKNMAMAPDESYMQILIGKMRKTVRNRMRKANPEYESLYKQMAKNEDKWKWLATEFKLRRPRGFEIEDMGDAFSGSARSNLQPTRMTETAVKRYPENNMLVFNTLDLLDRDLRKQIEISGINRRTEGGVARGSRNVKFWSELGAPAGAAAGATMGMAGGGPGGAAVGGAIGYGLGKIAGSFVGYIADRYGRKYAKKFLVDYAPKAGGVSKINQKFKKLSPDELNVLGRYLQDGSGAAAVAVLFKDKKDKKEKK